MFQERLMRIAELSRISGVPVPSIKYYLRAGLLPPGARTAPNQADYSEIHVHRLRLIRALIDVGNLSIAAVGDVLTAMDRPQSDLNESLGFALAATMPPQVAEDDDDIRTARQAVAELVERRGWQVPEGSPKLDSLAAALAVFFRLGQDDVADLVEMYADLAQQLGPKEIDWVVRRGDGDTDTVVEGAIIGTFIGGAVFNALRVIVHEDISRRTLAGRPAGLPRAES
jgi:DNA-binding transcriptional MerR regulator